MRTGIRTFAAAIVVFVAGTAAARGQALPSGSVGGGGGDIALTYHYVRTNTLGQCGCFGLTGVGLAGSWYIHPPYSIVAEASLEHTPHGPSGSSLTLSSYLAGVHYLIRRSGMEGGGGLQPYAQMLAGVGHAGGGVAGPGDKTNSMVARVGGGVDFPISPRLAIRVIRVDYDLTTFGNGLNNHQNNLLFGTGIIYQWAR